MPKNQNAVQFNEMLFLRNRAVTLAGKNGREAKPGNVNLAMNKAKSMAPGEARVLSRPRAQSPLK